MEKPIQKKEGAILLVKGERNPSTFYTKGRTWCDFLPDQAGRSLEGFFVFPFHFLSFILFFFSLSLSLFFIHSPLLFAFLRFSFLFNLVCINVCGQVF